MTNHYPAFLMFFLLHALTSFAASINEIRIKTKAGTTLSQELIRANMVLQEGKEFFPALLSRDIKSLFATKQFDDIEAKVVPIESEQVNIVLTVVPKAKIEKVVFKGNKLVSTKNLIQKITQKEGETFDEKLLSEDLQNLNDYYKDKGYYEVVVRQKVLPQKVFEGVKVTYEIDENPRYKTRGVDIIGNIAFSDRQLKRLIKTDVSVFGYVFPAGYFNDFEFSNDLDLLRQAYYDKGYLDFEIEKVDRLFDADKEKIYLTIFIEEGNQYSVKEVSITGNTAFPSDELEKFLTLRVNQDYSSESEQKDISRITEKYNRNGYIDCHVRPIRTMDSITNSVAVTYKITEGRPFTIRNINISGNRSTKDQVVRRELKILPGDLVDSSKISSSKASLINLGYFEAVDINPISTEEIDSKDLQVKVEEKLTGQLLFGAGFSSADDLLGTIEVAQSNFDFFNFPSFRGDGQRFRLRAQTGTSQQDFILSFTEPWLLDKPLRFDFEVWNRSTSSNRDFDQDSEGTSLRLTRKMKKPFWRQSFGYRLEEISINDIDLSFSRSFILEEEGDSLVSSLSFGFIRDHRDRLFFTSSGSRFSLTTELQAEFIGSYTNLYKVVLNEDKYIPIFKRAVLKLSGELGQVNKIEGDAPKIFDRFFTGGSTSIRGFEEREVGPIDEATFGPMGNLIRPSNEEPVGGKSILLASAELTGPIHEKTIFWAFFADSGNVWKNSFDWNLNELNVGVGGGLRLFLPIGAIQLDYGWPVVRDQEHLDSSGRFHFNLGHRF